MIKIELQNISGLRGVHTFEFKDGLSILYAPNTSGKSSLLNALHLIIGNKRLPQNILNNYLTEKEINGYVKLTFNNKNYEVQIQRKGENVNITYSNVDDNIFHFPSEELSYINRKSDLYQGILKNDNSMITLWFHKVTQIHKYTLFLEIATDILSELRTTKDDLKRKIDKDVSHNRDEINRLEREIKTLNKKVDDILNSEIYIQFMRNYEEKNKEIKTFRETMKKLRIKRQNLTDEINKYEDRLIQLKKELKDFKIRRKNFDDKYPIIKNKLDKKIKDKDDIEDRLALLNEELLSAEQELSNKRDLLNDYKGLLKRETCPKCHQKLDPIMVKDLVSKTESKVKKLESEVKSLKSERKILKEENEKIEDELIELTSFLKQNINDIMRKIKEDEENIVNINNTLKSKRSKREEISNKIEKINENLIKIQEELPKDIPQQNEVLKLQEEISSKEKLIRKLEEEIEESSEYYTEYVKMEKEVNRANAIHKYFLQKVRHLETETMEEITKALKNSFELLELAKLKKIEFNKKGNDYQIEIVRDNNVYTTLEKLSGAEKSLIALIISWVVKQMIIPNEPLFLVDEITTEMDDTRFRNILNYISKKTNYVVVARHKPYEGTREVLSSKHIIKTFI